MSGAPKVRAMQIIDELEPTKRGPYAGVVGYVDFSGNIDTAIAIRTMVVDPPGPDGVRRGSVQAGAGVVADSDPDDEELETRNKARALLVGGARGGADDRPAAGRGARGPGERAVSGPPTVAGPWPRDVLVVRGPDAVGFLQGQLSADVVTLEPGQSTLALLLEPTGKLEAVVRLWRTDEHVVVLDTDAGAGPAVEARLRRFLLRTDATIEALDWKCVAVRGPGAMGVDVDASGARAGRAGDVAGRGGDRPAGARGRHPGPPRRSPPPPTCWRPCGSRPAGRPTTPRSPAG